MIGRRRLRWLIGGGVAYGVAAWALALPPFKPAPVFYENVPQAGQAYTCNGGMGPAINVRFARDGKLALVRAGKQELRLVYRTSSGFDDVYEGNGWRLTLDPEANLTGPGGIRYGNCG